MGNFQCQENNYFPFVCQCEYLRSVFHCLKKKSMSTLDGRTIIQSSTYVNTIMPFSIYKHGSIADGMKYLPTIHSLRFSYQLKLPCFSPLKIYFISGRIAYWNLLLLDLQLVIQLEVASKYFLPGLLAETPIQIILPLNQDYVFWLSLECGVQSAY